MNGQDFHKDLETLPVHCGNRIIPNIVANTNSSIE